MDNQASYYNAASILIAYYNRRRTGKGTTIDSSATEIGIGLLGPILLDYAVNGRVTRRKDFPPGNRLTDQSAAPHGVYRCAGNDSWIALAVFSDQQWISLVKEMGEPSWAVDDRWSSKDGRYSSQDELDELIDDWTSKQDAWELTERLQARGVEAGLVQGAESLLERDPQLKHRHVHFTMDHPVVGPARFESVPIRFSRSDASHWRSAPLLGEDNDYVFGEVLGLSTSEVESLAAEGAI
jgi:crotonobetainyl-CoA:carnitine CoA-transferase CaiB-like acyl-CoA transferase